MNYHTFKESKVDITITMLHIMEKLLHKQIMGIFKL